MWSMDQKSAYRAMLHQGIDSRIAGAIVNEGFKSFKDFCAGKTTREMLRIPKFGEKSLRRVLSFAIQNRIKIRDDRLPVMPRMKMGDHTKHPKFEYTVLDLDDRYRANDILDILNDYGSQGWESSGMFRSMLIMKRMAR